MSNNGDDLKTLRTVIWSYHRKGFKKYILEIKEFKGITYLHPEHLTNWLSFSTELSGIERVLFIDSSRVTKTVREKAKEIKNFRIVDLSQVKELLQDNPVDILASSEE